MKTKVILLLAIAIAAALVTQPICASVINNIVLTENSSTSLTATYNLSTSGVTVTSIGTDGWNVSFPSSVAFNVSATVDWIEPESSGEVNAFTGAPTTHLALVFSEATTGNPKVADGTTVDNVGTDSVNGGTINVTFFDNGDVVATAPDTGSTLGLLSLSVVALLGATRLRFLELAA
jgi:hypothetical protein